MRSPNGITSHYAAAGSAITFARAAERACKGFAGVKPGRHAARPVKPESPQGLKQLLENCGASATPISDLHFLVAEDQEVQRRILVEMLTYLGAQSVLEASDGASALEIIQTERQPVDIVITDLAMSGMDGIEFIRRLRDAENPVSIIIISARDRSLIASVESMAAAYGIPILGTITKPATAEKLAALIEGHGQEPGMQQWSNAAGRTFASDEIMEGLKNDQFEPFFQPIVELETMKVKGAEALARWRHPQHGIIPPSAFIPTLEENSAIDLLTWVMLEKAMTAWHDWHTAGINGNVQVNLSIKSLDDLQLANRVIELAGRRNIHPSDVIFEITESAATIEMGRALENLARLRMNGFGLAIDDYGMGYASMQQLARVAFTELKVDQFFVRTAAKQESSRIILESSFYMAKRLGIESLAEGVETQAEWDLVLGQGCDLAQGYFIAPALQADLYINWLRDWTQKHYL